MGTSIVFKVRFIDILHNYVGINNYYLTVKILCYRDFSQFRLESFFGISIKILRKNNNVNIMKIVVDIVIYNNYYLKYSGMNEEETNEIKYRISI